MAQSMGDELPANSLPANPRVNGQVGYAANASF
jgi:hypothetical protein